MPRKKVKQEEQSNEQLMIESNGNPVNNGETVVYSQPAISDNSGNGMPNITVAPPNVTVAPPNVTVAPPPPAVNNISNELEFPKRVKVHVSMPLITFFTFLSVAAVNAILAIIIFFAVKIYYNELNLGDFLDTSAYEETLRRYENLVAAYETTIATYNSIVEGQDLNTAESDNDTTVSVNTIEPVMSEAEDFVVYLPESYEDSYSLEIDTIDAYAEEVGNKNIVWLSYDIEEMEKEGYSEWLDSLSDDEKPDLILFNTDYLSIFKEAGDEFASDSDIELKKADTKNMYAFSDYIGEDEDGNLIVFSYVVNPGYIQICADDAMEYFGTTDPDEIYETYMCDMETLAETCVSVYEESKGKVSLFGSIDEIQYMYDYAIGDPDIDFDEFVDIAGDSVYSDNMLDEDWFDNLEGNGKNTSIMGTIGAPWYTMWLMEGTVFDNNNLIIVKSPVDFYWGGNSAVVSSDTADSQFAADIIRLLTSDENYLIEKIDNDKIFVNNSDFIAGDDFEFDIDDYIYDDQDYIEFIDGLME